MIVRMSKYIYLFWNVPKQKWQTEENFTPNGGETFGGDWWIMPTGVTCTAPETFAYFFSVPQEDTFISIRDARGKLNNVSGLKASHKGEHSVSGDASYTGSTMMGQAQITTNKNGLPLLTVPEVRMPYVEYNGNVLPFNMCPPMNGFARN